MGINSKVHCQKSISHHNLNVLCLKGTCPVVPYILYSGGATLHRALPHDRFAFQTRQFCVCVLSVEHPYPSNLNVNSNLARDTKCTPFMGHLNRS